MPCKSEAALSCPDIAWPRENVDEKKPTYISATTIQLERKATTTFRSLTNTLTNRRAQLDWQMIQNWKAHVAREQYLTCHHIIHVFHSVTLTETLLLSAPISAKGLQDLDAASLRGIAVLQLVEEKDTRF